MTNKIFIVYSKIVVQYMTVWALLWNDAEIIFRKCGRRRLPAAAMRYKLPITKYFRLFLIFFLFLRIFRILQEFWSNSARKMRNSTSRMLAALSSQ